MEKRADDKVDVCQRYDAASMRRLRVPDSVPIDMAIPDMTHIGQVIFL